MEIRKIYVKDYVGEFKGWSRVRDVGNKSKEMDISKKEVSWGVVGYLGLGV